jgi:hypothetical protein
VKRSAGLSTAAAPKGQLISVSSQGSAEIRRLPGGVSPRGLHVYGVQGWRPRLSIKPSNLSTEAFCETGLMQHGHIRGELLHLSSWQLTALRPLPYISQGQNGLSDRSTTCSESHVDGPAGRAAAITCQYPLDRRQATVRIRQASDAKTYVNTGVYSFF